MNNPLYDHELDAYPPVGRPLAWPRPPARAASATAWAPVKARSARGYGRGSLAAWFAGLSAPALNGFGLAVGVLGSALVVALWPAATGVGILITLALSTPLPWFTGLFDEVRSRLIDGARRRRLAEREYIDQFFSLESTPTLGSCGWSAPSSVSSPGAPRCSSSPTPLFDAPILLGSVRKLVFPRTERPSTMVCTDIHTREARHLGSASTHRRRMGTDP